MIDIHSHILYGLDDGAKTLLDTMDMFNIADNDGICAVIATPHYNDYYKNDPQKTQAVFEEVKEKLSKEKPWIKLYLGNECSLTETLLKELKSGKCMTLAKSRYVLIEIRGDKILNITKRMLLDIINNDYIPVIAHVERLIAYKSDLNEISELNDMGCLLQINSSAVISPNKWWIKNWIMKSLKNGTISFVSSDAHDSFNRRPLLKKAYNIIEKKIGAQTAESVFKLNAQRILDSVEKCRH